MSKYTTEVRYILEHDAGYTESQGLAKINEIVDAAWDKTFLNESSGDVVIGTTLYTESICKKILKHYYTREIGAETVGLWKFWVENRMEQIADYYSDWYFSNNILSLEQALKDVNLTKTHEGEHDVTYTDDTNDTLTHNTTQADTGTVVDDGSVVDAGSHSETNKFSDTPQGGLTGIQNNNYLTDVRMIDGTDGNRRDIDNTRTNNLSSRKTGTEAREVDATKTDVGSDSYEETIVGKNGGKSYSELLMQYRKAIINLDKMIIDEFADLFINLW